MVRAVAARVRAQAIHPGHFGSGLERPQTFSESRFQPFSPAQLLLAVREALEL